MKVRVTFNDNGGVFVNRRFFSGTEGGHLGTTRDRDLREPLLRLVQKIGKRCPFNRALENMISSGKIEDQFEVDYSAFYAGWWALKHGKSIDEVLNKVSTAEEFAAAIMLGD